MAAALRWLALGDSYTIGEAVPAAGGWPAQLAARLRDAGIAVRTVDVSELQKAEGAVTCCSLLFKTEGAP